MPTETKTETKTTASTPFPSPPFPNGAFANPFAGFDPMNAWTQGQQAFHQMIADAYGRITSFAEEYAAMESQLVTRAQGAVHNWAQLTADAFAYGAQLSVQARKLGLENAKKLTHVA
ncbi:MAG: hypothetical protein ABJE66_31440 [Deltaproteobacteria bacterium]